MSTFDPEMTRVQAELDRLQAEEVEHFRQMRVEYDKRRGPLLRRLANLKALDADTALASSVPASTASETGGESADGSPRNVRQTTDDRKPTLAVVLDLLAGATEPVPSSAIDAAVVEAGWSKAASNKAKDRMRVSGLIAVDKRHYTITDAGRERQAGLASG